MKNRITGWKILALHADRYGDRKELQAMLTLGSATVSTRPALILWWTKPGTKRFVDSSTASSRSC
jgi:hypothetical protein